MPLLPPSILYLILSSKSSSVPCRQMRKVLPLVGFSGVVVPTIAPSLTVQKSFPSQPSSEVPLKIGVKPASASAATPLPEKERAARNPATRSHPPVKRAARTGHLRMGSTGAPSVRRPVTPGRQYATFAPARHGGPDTEGQGRAIAYLGETLRQGAMIAATAAASSSSSTWKSDQLGPRSPGARSFRLRPTRQPYSSPADSAKA